MVFLAVVSQSPWSYFLSNDINHLAWTPRYESLSSDGRWELSLIGRNLNDKATSNYGDDVPGQAGSVWRSMDAPRSYSVQLLARF
jgi:hypothetical protein